MCTKSKIFGVFLNESRITWLLAFHMLGNALTWPFITYLWAIYWASWMNWRRRKFESKETIVHCCLIHLCSSLHPFVLLSTHCCSSQAFHFLWAFHWDGGLKWWRPSWWTWFLCFDKVPTKFVTCIYVYNQYKYPFPVHYMCVTMNVIYPWM